MFRGQRERLLQRTVQSYLHETPTLNCPVEVRCPKLEITVPVMDIVSLYDGDSMCRGHPKEAGFILEYHSEFLNYVFKEESGSWVWEVAFLSFRPMHSVFSFMGILLTRVVTSVSVCT